MPPYNSYSYFGPQGALTTEQQIGGLDLPPGEGGGGLFLGGLGDALGGHINASLALKQQAALASMNRDQRLLALQEQQAAQDAAMGQRTQGFAERQAALERHDRMQAQRQQAALASMQAQQAGRRAGSENYEAVYGKQVGGANQVSGMIAASGDDPGAVFRGVRRGPSTMGRSTMVGVEAYQRPSAASFGGQMPSYAQQAPPQYADPYGHESAGQRTSRLRQAHYYPQPEKK